MSAWASDLRYVGCLLIMIQGIAEVDAFGTFAGAVSASAEVTLTTRANFKANPATGQVSGDGQIRDFTRKAGFDFSASSDSVVRFGVGPEVVVYPMPGVPVTLRPGVHLELRSAGTISFGQSTSFLQSAAPAASAAGLAQAQACAAVALNLRVTTSLSAFGIPDEMIVELDTSFLQDRASCNLRPFFACEGKG